MARGESPAVLRDVQTLFSLGTIHGLSDAQLLERFRSGTDPGSSETAFAGLVARHGSMVMGVCRRALHDPHDVADAFQATFLILVRKAETVDARDSLGRWLYGVSRRVAVRARRTATRRSAREVDGVESLIDPAPPMRERDDDLPVLLDEEIGRLPEKYRATMILCDLEGLSQEEAARELGCAVGTVKSRLSRGREKLRSRLIRRGVAPTAAIVAWCGDSVATEVPATLAEATVRAAIQYAASQAGAAGLISASVIDLAHGALRTMLFTKIRFVFATAMMIAALATGAGVLARQATAPQPPGEQAGDQEVTKVQDADDKAETSQPALPGVETPNGKAGEDEFDPIDVLQFETEMLAKELDTLSKGISLHLSMVSQREAYAKSPEGQKEVNALDAEARMRSEAEAASIHTSYLKRREIYLKKRKELRLKQQELERLLTASKAQPQIGNRYSTPDPSKLSPILEQRFRGLESKLDEVIDLLKELKH